MTPQEIFNALIQGTEVKLKKERFSDLNKELLSLDREPIQTNIFQVYQIEQSCVNLYNEETEDVSHDFSFDDIILYF